MVRLQKIKTEYRTRIEMKGVMLEKSECKQSAEKLLEWINATESNSNE